MSNKGYAVLLVLAGMVCGILLVSLASSPAAAKLPDEGRNATMNASEPARPKSVPPVVAAPKIRVYPVGMERSGSQHNPHAYVVKDGKLWNCEGTTARQVTFR